MSFRNQNGPLFKYVKKVGPNIRCHTNTLKNQALGTKRGSARRCGAKGCKTCPMILTEKVVRINNKKIHLSEGTCKSYNTCYLARCKICDKPYTGRTVDFIHKRVNGHRHLFLFQTTPWMTWIRLVTFTLLDYISFSTTNSITPQHSMTTSNSEFSM